MSRVHDALRRVETNFVANPVRPAAGIPVAPPFAAADGKALDAPAPSMAALSLAGILERVQIVPLTLSPDASLIDVSRPNEAPMEEFRTLRTRLNHLQGLQPIHSLVVTSPSPAEGKSFTAANLAIVQSQLEGNLTLLADFDFRRPVVHNLFQLERTPGVTDYLQGKAKLEEVIRRVEGTNLFLLPAGEAVINPLELLNLPEGRQLFELLPSVFNWVIIDTPPLLFAADANLISTLCHGTIMVVRVGATTIDSVTRAIQSLCQNNILGIVVNGAQKSELYHKYTYYHSYYYSPSDSKTPAQAPVEASAAEDEEDEE
jgi:receptor protein-tyrosine kinase